MEITQNCLRLFETASEYDDARNNDYHEPWVSYTNEVSAVTYNKTQEEKLLETPLTFEITGDGNIVWKAQNTAYRPTIEYKKNDGAWTSITSSTGGTNISVVSGDTVQFRGDNATYASGTSRYNIFSGTTCQFKVKGNLMSLINSTDFATATTLVSSYTFYYLFRGCLGLTSAKNLVLPATTLANYCYSNIFNGCTSLTSAPELPATTLANNCYENMFYGCTGLTTAPELPATTLVDYCYSSMFEDCSSLNYIKAMFTTTPGNSYTSRWVSGVAATGTFIKNSSATWTTTGVNGIPTGWTVLDA